MKFLKKALIGAAALVSGSLLLQKSAIARSCTSTISGDTFSGEICDFDAITGNSITVLSGAVVGGISQDTYTPASFIINNGTISNDTVAGINIYDSSLSDGLTNNGIINATVGSNSGILISNISTVSGGVSNSGSIISENYVGFQLDSGSIINDGISNSGSIISNSTNNPAMLIRSNSIVSGNINNSGTIRAYGVGDGLQIDDSSRVNGNINNSGTIRGGGSGLTIGSSARINGNINNSGTITGDTTDGIRILNIDQITGDVINSGNVSGHDNGISVDGFSTINRIINQAGATISGDIGLYINDTSILNAGIQNNGTITGSTKAIYVSSDSTVSSIDTFTGSVINGAIDATTTDLNINGGEINGTITAKTVNINSGVVFNMGNDITVTNAVNNAGTLAIGSSAQTIYGNYTQSTGGTLSISAQDTTSYGQLEASGGTVDLSQSGAIDVNILNGANIVIGDTLNNVILGNTLVVPTGGFNVSDNSLLLNFTGLVNGGSNGVNLTAVDDTTTSISQSNSALGNNGGAAAASKLDGIITSNPSGDWQNVIGAFNTLNSNQEITDAVNQTVPALIGASNSATIETMNTGLRIVQARQKSDSGVSSGEDFQTNRNLWIKTFGSWGNQNNKDGVIGYDSNAYGVVTGADKDISDKARLGVAVSYLNSKLTSNNNNNQVNVDSVLGIVYGNYSLDDKTEINTQVATGYNHSNSNRYINFGGLSRTAKSSYDGWSFSAGTGISRLVNVTNDTTIAPQFRVDYFVVGNQSYNESGAGALDLNVASQTQAQLIPALEIEENHKFTPTLSFSLNGGLGYDLLHDANTVSASFAGGGGEFITRGLEPSPWIIRSGAGITWKQSDELDFTVRYDRRDRGSYDNQTVSLKLCRMF